MKTNRTFKYYLTFYGIATIFYAVYMVVQTRNTGGIQLVHIIMVLIVPLMFIIFLYLFDTITKKFFPQSKSNAEDEDYKIYLHKVTKAVNEELKFTIEDVKRLRDNDKFQKALYHCYLISKDGETTDINFAFIQKKFKKDTNEYKAIKIVIDEVKKMTVN